MESRRPRKAGYGVSAHGKEHSGFGCPILTVFSREDLREDIRGFLNCDTDLARVFLSSEGFHRKFREELKGLARAWQEYLEYLRSRPISDTDHEADSPSPYVWSSPSSAY